MRPYRSHAERVASRRPAPGLTARYALTVRGPVREDQMGVVLPHEHILLDLRRYHEPSHGVHPLYPELAHRPLALDMLGSLRRHPTTCLDNLVLDDVEEMADELKAFARAGGGTVVDLTSGGPRLEVQALPRIAEETGLHIIAGTGLYASLFYPHSLAQETEVGIWRSLPSNGIWRSLPSDVDGLAEWFAREVEQGIEGTAIRAGVIGKLEIHDPAYADQEKVLRAAARAALRTGAPLAVELALTPGPPPSGLPAFQRWERGPSMGRALDRLHRILQEEGVPPAKVLLCGMDRAMPQEERLRAARLGYYLLFDGFGKEWYVRGGEERTPRDPERLRWLKELIEAGHRGTRTDAPVARIPGHRQKDAAGALRWVGLCPHLQEHRPDDGSRALCTQADHDADHVQPRPRLCFCGLRKGGKTERQ